MGSILFQSESLEEFLDFAFFFLCFFFFFYFSFDFDFDFSEELEFYLFEGFEAGFGTGRGILIYPTSSSLISPYSSSS